MSIRPATAVSLLLSVILPLGLLAGTNADASTSASEPAVASANAPATAGGTGGGGRQTPRVAKENLGTSSSNAIPKSAPQTPSTPLPSPSPLNTKSPLIPKPDSTGIENRADNGGPQARAVSHTVTFNSAGGSSVDPQSVSDGEQASRPDKDPLRDCYAFDGWFTGNIAYDFNQPVTKDITLTAKWTKGASAWSINPASGPATGGTKATLTPPVTPGIRFSQISAGGSIGSDGNLYSWGHKDQLARSTASTPINQSSLVTPPAGIKFTQTDAGTSFTLAIGSDGNLYSWGDNTYGQLGRNTNGKPDNKPGKVLMPAGIRFTWISAGGQHSLALSSDGNLYSWGDNSKGQLGRNTAPTTGDRRPGKVPLPVGIQQFTRVSAGGQHSLALGSDGNLYSWGDNTYGQLGRETTSAMEDNQPDKITLPVSIQQFTRISAGQSHSLALGSDGNLYSWGDNNNNQLGRATNGRQDSKPSKIVLPTGVTSYFQVCAGQSHSLALGSDGNLYSWGDNNSQLGRATNGRQDSKPDMVAFPEKPKPTKVRFDTTPGNNLIANTDGTWSVTTPAHPDGQVDVTLTWRMNDQQTDTRLKYTYEDLQYYKYTQYTVTFDPADGSPTPQKQTIIKGSQAKRPATDPVKAGWLFDGWFLKKTKSRSDVAYDFSQPVTSNITVVAHWSPAITDGWSISPNKGNILGGQQTTITPPKVSRGIRLNQVSTGGYRGTDNRGFSVGVGSDGNAYAWGSNQHGQLGQDPKKTPTQKMPTAIPLPDGVAAGFSYTQVAAGGYHVLAIGSDDIVYSWGANDHGQLGDNATTDHSKPQPVKGAESQPFKAVQVSAGAYDSAAIGTDGHVYTWGSESNDRADSTRKLKPTLVKDPNGSDQGLQAVHVSTKYSFVMALDADSNVYAWGYNNWGQLGNGRATGDTSTTYTPDPVSVHDPNDDSKIFKAVQISAGWSHAMAIGQDGNTYAWGNNGGGRLGDGTDTSKYRSIPTHVYSTELFQASQVSAGVNHSMAIDQNGAIWAWGYNEHGQLGINSTSNQSRPQRVSPPADQGNTGKEFTATRISAGWGHSLAIGQDGSIYAWGDNQYGQLGNTSIPTGASNSKTRSLVPVTASLDSLLITGVSFDKTTVGTLRQNSDGSVTLATPTHNPGQTDVIVDWTLGGVNQIPAHLAYIYKGLLPHAGSSGIMILLAAGLLAAAGAAAAGRHRWEARRLQA